MTYNEEELQGANVKEIIYKRVSDLMNEIPDKRRFIMGSGCGPSPKARYENMIMLRDATWKYGSIQ